MATPLSELLMVDPSLALSGEGLVWLEEDEEARHSIVISAAFMEWLRGERDIDLFSVIAPEDVEMADERRRQLVSLLGDAPTFSYQDAHLSREGEAVRVALLESAGPAAEVHADEWAFLQSHSFLASKVRHPLDAFRDAGAVIVEFGRKVGGQLVRRVIPAERVPRVLTAELMAKATVKWIVVGGATVGGGTLGGVLGTAIGGPPGAFIGGKAGGLGGGAIANAAVMAIDPRPAGPAPRYAGSGAAVEGLSTA